LIRKEEEKKIVSKIYYQSFGEYPRKKKEKKNKTKQCQSAHATAAKLTRFLTK